MTRTRLLAAILGTAALVLAVTALLWSGALRGSGHEDDPHTGSDSSFDVHGPVPDGAGPTLAAEHGLAALFTWQPVTDASPGAAVTRALPWLTGTLAAAAGGGPAPEVRTLPEWARWRDAADIVVASATATGTRDCDARTCAVSVRLTQTVQHTDQSTSPYRVLTITAATVSTPHGWRLTDYRVTR
ncbi:hypothetical protein JK358_37310 [Nocardia sp. 2]|uniref:Mce-associated membrane protein n=1 Tax=Nocardia acididurans TaxID=2802282 RepID=A0ABS1MHC5_9NOCA|nr:hypothetical protein [Nocardia acididurans]MBL1080071.1 hypothetical protein [Nocardia acididurans]